MGDPRKCSQLLAVATTWAIIRLAVDSVFKGCSYVLLIARQERESTLYMVLPCNTPKHSHWCKQSNISNAAGNTLCLFILMRGVQWSTTKKSSKWWSLEISKDWKIAKDDAVSAPGLQGDVHFYVWNTLKYYILLRCFGVACLFVPSSPITSSQPLAVALYHQSNTASVQKHKGNVNRKRKCQRTKGRPPKKCQKQMPLKCIQPAVTPLVPSGSKACHMWKYLLAQL